MQDYKKLKVWEKSHQFVFKVYDITNSFPDIEKYNIVAQLKKAVVSIPTNIAEGCGRKTSPDFSRFIQIAIGSSSEVEYLLTLSYELGFINGSNSCKLMHEIISIRKMLINLNKKIKRS